MDQTPESADLDPLKIFWDLVEKTMDEEGVQPMPAVALRHDGKIIVAMMDIPPNEIVKRVHQDMIADLNVKEVVFGLDCFTKPGQGTEFADVVTVYRWKPEDPESDVNGFRYGVINYQYAPERIVRPIDWTNTHWAAVMGQQMQQMADFARKAVTDKIEVLLGITESEMMALMKDIRLEIAAGTLKMEQHEIMGEMLRRAALRKENRDTGTSDSA